MDQWISSVSYSLEIFNWKLQKTKSIQNESELEQKLKILWKKIKNFVKKILNKFSFRQFFILALFVAAANASAIWPYAAWPAPVVSGPIAQISSHSWPHAAVIHAPAPYAYGRFKKIKSKEYFLNLNFSISRPLIRL
jgi:hypothetical protein